MANVPPQESLNGRRILSVARPVSAKAAKVPEAVYAGPTAHTLTDLPDGMDPNPPAAGPLAKFHRTWKGEYEADNYGMPVLDAASRPIPVLYTKGGKRVKSAVKLPKGHLIRINSGILTVDGWPGKARLNYDILDLKFIYLSAPKVGTVIVSPTSFPGAEEQTEAFNQNLLTVTVSGHEFQLASDRSILGKVPQSAWVKFDEDFTEDPLYPVMGFGGATAAPYMWPGAKSRKAEGVLNAPDIPKSLQPKLEGRVCVKNCSAKDRTAAALAEEATSPARLSTRSTPKHTAKIDADAPQTPEDVTATATASPQAAEAASPATVQTSSSLAANATPIPAATVAAPPQAPSRRASAALPPQPSTPSQPVSTTQSGFGSSTVTMTVKPKGAKK